MAKVTLVSSDSEFFEVDVEVAMMSPIIKAKIAHKGTENPLKLPQVQSNILIKVIEYCKFHSDSYKDYFNSEEEIQTWDKNFLLFDQDTIFYLFKAADYLEITGLLNLTRQSVAAIKFSSKL